jgi:hypothetical protein
MQIPCVYLPGPAPAVSVANTYSHSAARKRGKGKSTDEENRWKLYKTWKEKSVKKTHGKVEMWKEENELEHADKQDRV